MSWAGNRRLGIILVIMLVVIGIVGGVLALVLPQEPTCSDGIWNQDEAGVDCGGSCAYLCTSLVVKPSVSFVRAVTSNGRIDIVGLVENRNPSARAKAAKYTVDVYAPDASLVATGEGVIDLPAGESVPLFIPGIAAAGAPIGQVLLTFDDASLAWAAGSGGRTLPRADAIRVSGGEGAPRVTANLFNPSALPLRNVRVVATVYDESGAVMAATQTLVEALGPEASVPLTFSWNQPFIAVPGKVTVQAIIPLP